MTGRHIERIARALVRRSTFELVVSPAIADLQHESRLGQWPTLRAYAAVWRTLAVSLVMEIGSDSAAAMKAAPLRRAIVPSLLTLAVTFAIASPWGVWLEFGRWRPWHHDLVLIALLAPGVLATTLPLVAMPVATVLARAGTSGATRAAVLLASALVATLAMADWSIADRTSDLQRELSMASLMSVRTGDAERPVWELREKFRPRIEQIAARADDPTFRSLRRTGELRRARLERHARAALLLTVVAYALLGAARRRQKPWTAALAATVVFVAVSALRLVFQRLYVQMIFGPLVLVWPPAVLLLLVALLAALRARPVAVGPA